MSVGKEKPCLPYGWEVHQSTTYPERVYYYNTNTGISSWKCPQLISPADSSQGGPSVSLPPLLADRSIVFPEEKKLVSSKKIVATVTSPKSLPKLPPAYSKATSPQCVSSTSEVKVSSLSSNTGNSKSEPSESMPCRKKLVRPVVNETSVARERSNSHRYNPYNTGRKEAKDQKTTSNLNSSQPEPCTKSKTKEVNLKFNSYNAEKAVLSTSLSSPATKKKKKASQLSSTLPSVSRTPVQRPWPQIRSQSETAKPNSLKSRTAQNASKICRRYSPMVHSNAKTKSSISPMLLNKNNEIRRTPEKGNSTAETQSDGSVPVYLSDVEMVDVSNDAVDSHPSKVSSDATDLNSSKGFFVIVDTNVLISNLKFVDELKDSPLEGCGPPTVIVPWVVLQELDHIKNGKYKEEKVQKASEAVRYIYEMFSAKHPRICGQSSLENPSKLEGSLEPSCNDDMILHCCLQMCKKVPSEKVILLTNDKNLCNKATVHQVQAYTADTLFQNLKVDFTDIAAAPAYAMSCNISVSNELKKNEGNLRLEVDRVMIKAKLALKNCLGEFLQTEMYSAYEGDMWLKVVHLKPPWSLLDILECLNKHWIAVFNFVLSKSMKSHIEKMHSALKTTKGYIFDEEQALGLVSSGISLCTNIAGNGLTIAKETLDKLVLLQKQLLCLGKNNTHVKSDVINSNESENSGPSNAPSLSVNQRRSSESLVVIEQDPSSEMNTRVKMVFQHVWFILNHLCGTVLDSLEWPHKLEYSKPPTLPSKDETNKFIPVLYPELQKLRKYMMSVVPAKDICDDKFKNNISSFYKQVLSILPTLNVNKGMPVAITEEEFKQFCTNLDNKEILQGGLKQLLHFFALIHKSIMGTAGHK